MPFDISFAKPRGRELDPNEVWLQQILHTFPELSTLEKDSGHLAELLAPDAGMTPGEYLARGIGLEAVYESETFWICLGFWDSTATIELPNYPECGVETALDIVGKYVQFLDEVGFSVLHPGDDSLLKEPWREVLTDAYKQRQSIVALASNLMRN
ncbi:MAG: hypothetical protein AAF974_04160 [Cyanobacteria bacterium P01_E01_bin.34]